jgi:thiol:disulfide interchange protein
MKQGYTIFFLATLLAGSFLYYRFALSSYDSIPNEKGIYFEKDYESAKEKSEKTGKPLLLSFYGSWCGACKKLKKEVYADEQIGKLYRERFIAVNVDGESKEGMKLREEYRVNAYPTMIWITENNIIHREDGYIDLADFRQKSLVFSNELKTKSNLGNY